MIGMMIAWIHSTYAAIVRHTFFAFITINDTTMPIASYKETRFAGNGNGFAQTHYWMIITEDSKLIIKNSKL